MWPRAVEWMLGLWLLVSPFIFDHGPDQLGLWLTDLICGTAIVVLALASCSHRLRQLHLLELPVALWLLGHGYLVGGYPSAPGYQNEILIGLTVLLLAIAPSEASLPPEGWRRHANQN